MSIIKVDYGEIGGGGRLKYVSTTTWNAYPSAKTFTIDPTHIYMLVASNTGGLNLNYIIQNGVMYEDTYTAGTYPITATLSGTTLTVSAQPSLNTGCELYEYELV